jgi:transcriptional regulator with XRE-family HTH domain
MEILSLGEKIKYKRKELDMTLKDLAGDKVTPGQISLVESGKSKPSMDLLEYIAEKLNVSIDYILETENHQAERLCKYYLKISEASILMGNYEQAAEAINMNMAYATKYNIESLIGLGILYRGKIDYFEGNYKDAHSSFITANEIFLRNSENDHIIETYLFLGMTTYELSCYEVSLNFFKQAEKIINENNIINDDMLAKIYFNISKCCLKLKNYNGTIDYALLAMNKYKKKSDKFQYGQSLLMLSLSYHSLDRFSEATKFADEAIQIFKELDDKKFVAKMETNMGVILSQVGNIEESFVHLNNSYDIKLGIDDDTLPYTMLKMADNYMKTNDIDKAIEIVNDVIENSIYKTNCSYVPMSYYYLYKLYILKKDSKKAELYMLAGIKYLESSDMKKELAFMYITISDFYEKQNNFKKAIDYKDKGIGLYKNLNDFFEIELVE